MHKTELLQTYFRVEYVGVRRSM